MSEAAMLEVRDLEVRYGRADAVRRVSFEVRPGEVVGLIGPDGAGKTSTLRVLAGLARAGGGSALAFGEDCWRRRRRGSCPNSAPRTRWKPRSSTRRRV